MGDPEAINEFISHVMRCEKLTHWEVDIWGCKGEGLCGEKISFGICETFDDTKWLFLHEVAHAILNPKRSAYLKDWHPDSYFHEGKWQEEMIRLHNTYIGGALPVKWLSSGNNYPAPERSPSSHLHP